MSTDEKDPNKPPSHVGEISPPPTSVPPDVDDAWKFLDTNRDAYVDDGEESVNMAAIRRKIDYRILPLGFLLFTMQFTDKLVLNVSSWY